MWTELPIELVFEEARRALLDHLPTSEEEAKTEKELRKLTGLGHSTVHRVLRELAEAEQVARAGAGKRGDPYRFWLPHHRS